VADKREIPVDECDPHPDQQRKIFDPANLLQLGNNLLAFGQLLPVIVYWLQATKRYILLDGERRWRAAKLVGIKQLIALVLDHEPTAAELRQLQMCIEVHKIGLSVLEESDALVRIKQENNWSVSELAEKLHMKQPRASKVLRFKDACPELREALRNGFDQDKALAICLETDHAKQRELLKHAEGLTRQQVRQKARSGGQPVEMKTAVARFCMPKGFMVTVQGPKMTLDGAIDTMQLAIRELKKGQADHWDITTAVRVLKDRAQASSPQQ